MKVFLKSKEQITESIINKIEELQCKVEYTLTVLPILCVEVNDLTALSALDFIECIEFDELFDIHTYNMLPNIRINKLKKESFVGSNSVVGVIDTGMNPDSDLEIHKDVIVSCSGSPNDAKLRGRLHGTCVGKIIQDIAPWAKIVNIKVADDSQDIRKESVLKALEFAYTNNIKIINMSIGKKSVCDDSCITCGIVNKMFNEGFVIVAAIGNYGQEGIGITGCPGNAEKAFTVGAVDPNKQLADYSSCAPSGKLKPNVLAPGRVIIKGVPFDGTSCAAPIITGIIAALANDYTIGKILQTLEQTSRSINLPRNQQGHGLINIEALLEVLKNEKNITEAQR